jgi:hypothetical protein
MLSLLKRFRLKKKKINVNSLITNSRDTLLIAIEKCNELKTQRNKIIDILLRECPKYERFIRANFPDYFK